MHAKKLVFDLDSEENQSMRKRISRHAANEASLKEMLKDVHLLEGALETDKIVASRNETERILFSQISNQIEKIREIMWVNPDTDMEYCLDWLKRGAPVEEHRQLGYQIER